MVALARVTRPVGLKGGVRVELLCDGPERLRDVQRMFLGPDPHTASPAVLTDVSERGNGVVIFLEGCGTREEAERLRDQYLFIEESESVPSPDGAPRIHELVGCAVYGSGGDFRGTVENIYDLPGSRMLGVRATDGGREVLVPFVDAWVARFDPDQKRIDLTSDELFTEL